MKYNYSSNFSMHKQACACLCLYIFIPFFLGWGGSKYFMAYEHFVCQYFSLFPSSSFVVISVYCFLYIFQLERTKSYSKCQSSYLAKPHHFPLHSLPSLSAHLFALCLYFVPCHKEQRETPNCRVNMFYICIYIVISWLMAAIVNGVMALHVGVAELYICAHFVCTFQYSKMWKCFNKLCPDWVE